MEQPDLQCARYECHHPLSDHDPWEGPCYWRKMDGDVTLDYCDCEGFVRVHDHSPGVS